VQQGVPGSVIIDRAARYAGCFEHLDPIVGRLGLQHRVDDASANAMLTWFGNDRFIQLTGAIGYYRMLVMTVNACELEVAPNAEVLKV
jgi:hypothetical protein